MSDTKEKVKARQRLRKEGQSVQASESGGMRQIATMPEMEHMRMRRFAQGDPDKRRTYLRDHHDRFGTVSRRELEAQGAINKRVKTFVVPELPWLNDEGD